MPDDLEINFMQRENGFVAVGLRGVLNAGTGKRLTDIVSTLYEQGYRAVALSCESLSFLDSGGLAVLLDLARRLTTEEGQCGLSLCAINADVKGTLQVSGLLRRILVYEDAAQAQQYMNLS